MGGLIDRLYWRMLPWWLKVTRRCPQCAVKRPGHKMGCRRR